MKIHEWSCGDRAKLLMIGAPHNSSALTGDFVAPLKELEQHLKLKVHLLRVQFKNEALIDFGKPESFIHELVGDRESVRAFTIGDVGFVPWGEDRRAAIAFLNADSPFIALSTPWGLYALHGGFKCLCPLEGGVSVFDTAFAHMQANFDLESMFPEQISMVYGGGIGLCCYGLSGDHLDKHLRAMASRYYNENRHDSVTIGLGLTVSGPRMGQVAIDLSMLAHQELLRSTPDLLAGSPYLDGIRQHYIAEQCFACMKEVGQRVFWSQTWDGDLLTEDGKPLNPRNLTAFVVERPL